MTILAIDTALASLRLALFGPGVDLRHVQDMEKGQAEALFPAIEALLGKAGKGTDALTAIAVNTGPGSFTGTRVGVAAAKGLAFALGVPLHGITTLQALAVEAGGEPCAVIMDARRGEVYLQLFAGDGPAQPPMVIGVEGLRQMDCADRVIVGSGAHLVTGQPHRLVREVAFPDPLVIAELAFRGVGRGPARPFYLRDADAKPQLDRILPRRTPGHG